jgi:hypothetical protein
MGSQQPQSGSLSHCCAPHLRGAHATPAQVRTTWRSACRRDCADLAPDGSLYTAHPTRSTACLTTLHGPWGFTTRKAAAAALRAEIRRLEVREWVEPTKQRLDAYLAEWVAGQRLSASTLSSYGKNIRLHVDPRAAAKSTSAT